VIAIVISIHVLVCISMCIVVLLQQGKGADVGAVFGGSSQTIFGSSGAGNFLTKLTAGLAVVFFATSIFLAYSSARRATGSVLEGSSKSVMPLKAAPAKKPAGVPQFPAPAPVAPVPAVPNPAAPKH
jgi:preprotein translocase subunit SecG